MVNLLKTFAKGLLYVIGLPFFLVALAIFGVIGLIAFIFQIIKSIIFFFTGQKFFPELPEDKELRLLKEGPKEPVSNSEMVNEPVKEETNSVFTFLKEEPQEATLTTQSEPVIEENKPVPTIEEACFETPKEEVAQEEAPVVQEDDPFAGLLNNEVEESKQEDVVLPQEEEKPIQKETVLETASKDEDDELMEELETYVPRSSNYGQNIDEDDDNDTDDMGVNINYDL